MRIYKYTDYGAGVAEQRPPLDQLLDSELLRLYSLWKDEAAFGELVRRHRSFVHRICLSITRSHHDAEDLAQECFLKLACGASLVKGSVRGWLRSAARSRSIDFKRRATVRTHHETNKGQTVESDEIQDRTGDAEVLPLVMSALDAMPEKVRGPLVQRYVHGVSCAEIAQKTGVTRTTVATRVNRGLVRVRQWLRRIEAYGRTADAIGF